MVLSKEKKENILKLKRDGFGYKKIAKITKLTRDVVRGVCLSRVVTHPKKRGRKTKLNKVIKLKIKRCISRLKSNQEKVNSTKIRVGCDLSVSNKTIQRHIKSIGMKYRKIKRKISLSKDDKLNRKNNVLLWLSENHPWEMTVFSDEKWFTLDGTDDNRTYMYDDEQIIQSKRQRGGGGVMVWAMTMPNGLVAHKILERKNKSKDYIDILRMIVVPISLMNLGSNFWFQHDNAPIHRSKETKKFISETNLKVLTWPPRSPDLNIVENLWKIVNDIVYSHINIQNRSELIIKINNAFMTVNTEKRNVIQSLYSSYRKRLCSVLGNSGNLFN